MADMVAVGIAFFVGVGVDFVVGVGVLVGFGVQTVVGSGVLVGSSVGVGVGVGSGSERLTVRTASSPVELSLAPVYLLSFRKYSPGPL